MGIKDLYKVIYEHGSEGVGVVNLEDIKGLRIAVDISVFLYKFIRTAGDDGDKWLNAFIHFLCTFKKHRINCICIFDGPNPPPEKKEEQLRRRAENAKAQQRLFNMRNIQLKLSEYCDNLKNAPDELVEEARGVLSTNRKLDTDDLEKASQYVLKDMLWKACERIDNQSTPITEEHTKIAMDVTMRIFGLPGMRADGEAEGVCSYLAETGVVDAVLTEDTDVLAYRTPKMLAMKDFKLHEEKLHIVNLDLVCKEMDLTKHEFTDLCILLSTDYNKRVKGYPPDRKCKKPVGIGAKGAYAMIKEYRTIEMCESWIEDISPLKYDRCRDIFNYSDLGTIKKIKPVKELNEKELEKLIVEKKLYIKMDYIRSFFYTNKNLVTFDE